MRKGDIPLQFQEKAVQNLFPHQMVCLEFWSKRSGSVSSSHFLTCISFVLLNLTGLGDFSYVRASIFPFYLINHIYDIWIRTQYMFKILALKLLQASWQPHQFSSQFKWDIKFLAVSLSQIFSPR